MKPYRLDRRVVLLEPRPERDPATGETVAGEPAEHPCWAARRDLGGRERLRDGVEFGEERARFVIRWRDGVRPHWRLRDERGAEHAIEGLAEIGRRRYLEILAARAGR